MLWLQYSNNLFSYLTSRDSSEFDFTCRWESPKVCHKRKTQCCWVWNTKKFLFSLRRESENSYYKQFCGWFRSFVQILLGFASVKCYWYFFFFFTILWKLHLDFKQKLVAERLGFVFCGSENYNFVWELNRIDYGLKDRCEWVYITIVHLFNIRGCVCVSVVFGFLSI